MYSSCPPRGSQSLSQQERTCLIVVYRVRGLGQRPRFEEAVRPSVSGISSASPGLIVLSPRDSLCAHLVRFAPKVKPWHGLSVFALSELYVTHEPIQSLMLGSSDCAMLPELVLKSVRQYTRKFEPSTVNWVSLIAGQFNGRMLFVGFGNADEVLVDADVVEVGLVEAVDADAVADAALVVTAASAVLLGLEVALALLALLELLVLFLVTRAPTTPPTTAPMMTSKATAATMSAVFLVRPHQRRG